MTSEFFVYFSMFRVHDEKKNSTSFTTKLKFMDPSIINYLLPLQYVFAECFLDQSVFLFCSSSSSFFRRVQAARH